MNTMTKRSNRLRLVVKESGKTAKEIINSFDIMEKNDRTGSLQLPKDPITISRHINAKRSFDIDMAVAYGKALDSDPADICFEPIRKNIRGWVDPLDTETGWKVVWYDNRANDSQFEEIKNVRVPREFYGDKFRIIEFKNVKSYRHGGILIYRKSDALNYNNPRYFNQLSLCQLGDWDNDEFVVGVPIPLTKNKFMIVNLEKGIIKESTKIRVIHPIVNMILPSFYDNFKDNY